MSVGFCCPSGIQGRREGGALSPICMNCNYAEWSLFRVGPSGLERAPQEIRLLPGTFTHAFFTKLKNCTFLAVLESGAPLNSPLEGALYKFMNE